jgi:hypothetical protein
MRRFATKPAATFDQLVPAQGLPFPAALRRARSLVAAVAQAQRQGQTIGGPVVVTAEGEVQFAWRPGALEPSELGEHLFHLLTGTPRTRPAAPSTLNRLIDESLDELLLTLLAGDEVSCGVLEAALDLALDEYDEPAPVVLAVARTAAAPRRPVPFHCVANDDDELDEDDDEQPRSAPSRFGVDVWAVSAAAFAVVALGFVFIR